MAIVSEELMIVVAMSLVLILRTCGQSTCRTNVDEENTCHGSEIMVELEKLRRDLMIKLQQIAILNGEFTQSGKQQQQQRQQRLSVEGERGSGRERERELVFYGTSTAKVISAKMR